MTAVTLPNTGLAAGYLDEEDGWGAGVNKNFRLLDALVQPRVIDKDLTAPPGSPVAGDVYIPLATATGAWAGQENKLAIWQVGDDLTSAWTFVTPKEGWIVWMTDEDRYYMYTGSAWEDRTVKSGQPIISDSTTSSAVNVDRTWAGKYYRFTGTGAKSATFRPNATHALDANSEFTFTNRAASGNLTLVFTAPATGAVPALGTLVVGPGMTVTVKRITTDVFDVIGHTVAA